LGLAKETVSMVLAQTSSSSREPFVHVEMIEGSKMASFCSHLKQTLHHDKREIDH
jgi:hypothetical protein